MKFTNDLAIKLRTPRVDDLRGIVAVVRSCEPWLTAHNSYLYWMYLCYSADTCVVAEHDGEIVGLWSFIPVGERRYFIHQMAVAPAMRKHGLGRSLAAFLINKIKDRHPDFELEFTIDRKNAAMQKLIRTIAADADLRLTKRAEAVELLEEGCEEELYTMAPTPAVIGQCEETVFAGGAENNGAFHQFDAETRGQRERRTTADVSNVVPFPFPARLSQGDSQIPAASAWMEGAA